MTETARRFRAAEHRNRAISRGCMRRRRGRRTGAPARARAFRMSRFRRRRRLFATLRRRRCFATPRRRRLFATLRRRRRFATPRTGPPRDGTLATQTKSEQIKSEQTKIESPYINSCRETAPSQPPAKYPHARRAHKFSRASLRANVRTKVGEGGGAEKTRRMGRRTVKVRFSESRIFEFSRASLRANVQTGTVKVLVKTSTPLGSSRAERARRVRREGVWRGSASVCLLVCLPGPQQGREGPEGEAGGGMERVCFGVLTGVLTGATAGPRGPGG